MALPDFIRYFQDKAQFHTDGGRDVTISCREIGSLLVPSGRIVACDPFVYPDALPFTKQIKPGLYPVILSIACNHKSGDERVALAMLRIRASRPQKWEVAVTPEEDLSKLTEDEYYGYPVDAGLGCFMSEEASCVLTQKMDENVNYYEYIVNEMEKVYIHTRDWVDWTLDDSGLNAVIFSSGFGDGCYACYWGYDNAGEVACLLVDFGVLGWGAAEIPAQ